MLKHIISLLLLNAVMSASAQYFNSTADSIRYALKYQIQNYPISQYRDVYKNFMQDFFGPGHILNDTAASGKYLRHELSSTVNFEGPDYEPTGYMGNFYRVNIGLIADGTIPYGVFFPAFVNSIQGIIPPDGETWMNIWNNIDSVIKEEGYSFVNENQDRQNLEEQFKEGNYIVHHSKTFDDSVNFHYRIISKDNFEKILLPYINAKKMKK